MIVKSRQGDEGFKRVALVILDGWGIGAKYEGNPIVKANLPFYDELLRQMPNSVLAASGEAVGLPRGLAGNSEVGHLNLGSGRIPDNELSQINEAIKDKTFFKNPSFLAAINHVKENKSTLHLMGIISEGRIHGDVGHVMALLRLSHSLKVPRIALHIIADGRDSRPRSLMKLIREVEKYRKNCDKMAIASVMGRFYAMDRARNYDRTKTAYDLLVHGKGEHWAGLSEATDRAYRRGLSDEMIPPATLGRKENLVKGGDAVIFFNLRSDRARQLSKMFVLPTFTQFKRGPALKNLYFCGMTGFGEDLPMSIAYATPRLKNTLPEYLGKYHDKVQAYLTEEEKYGPLVYFFHGGSTHREANERVSIVKSRKVSDWALAPEMSASEVTSRAQEMIHNRHRPDLLVINYPNADMVGHTGNMASAVKALEVLDRELARLCKFWLRGSAALLITADHGNIECKLDPVTGEVLTNHSTNPVPAILVQSHNKYHHLRHGKLCDVAPTILELMGLPVPEEMNGKSLLGK